MLKERGIRVSSTWSRCWSCLAGGRPDRVYGRRCRSRYADVTQYDARCEAEQHADSEQHANHDAQHDRDHPKHEAECQADDREAAEAPGQAGIAGAAGGTEARLLGLPGR